MASYTDCTPFDDTNVVPGDSYEIGQLASHYRSTAQEISAQATQLKKLAGSAAGGAWGGQSGKNFTSKAQDLATSIEKVHGRYDTAATVLQNWANEIDGLQQAVATLAEHARSLQTTVAQNQPAPTTANAPKPTAAQQQATQTAATNLTNAQNDLATTRHNYDKAVQAYKDAAKAQGDALRKVADHDSVHDSTWDKIKGWVSDHADIINKIIKYVTYAVTALAIAALVISLFVPGLDILSAAALAGVVSALETTAAAGSAVLAVSQGFMAVTGNGSWSDVALDLVGVASFGTSRVFASAAEDAIKVARTPAEDAAYALAKNAKNEVNAGAISRLTKLNRIPLVRTLTRAGGRLDAYAADAESAGSKARAGVTKLFDGEAETTLTQRLGGFGDDAVSTLAKLRAINEAVPGVPEVEQALTKVQGSIPVLRTVGAGAMGLDTLNHVQQDVFPHVGLGGVSKWIEEHTTRQLPFTTFTPPQVAMGAPGGGG